jgi:rhodanese-related sulfurtransferase
MALHNYIKKIPVISMDDYRVLLSEESREAVSLIDVRQPEEFERDYIPGPCPCR